MRDSFKIYPNVEIGKNAQIDESVIIGYPPVGKKPGELKTVIGSDSRLRSNTVIYAGSLIGDNFETGHNALIREYSRIGSNVFIGANSVIQPSVQIANGVKIHALAGIGEFSVIEEGCWVGPGVIFANVLHPLCPDTKKCMKGPTVRRYVKIGANSVILPGIVIEEEALIGAGSIVNKNVPAKKVAIGNPAKAIKDIEELKCPYNLIDKPYVC